MIETIVYFLAGGAVGYITSRAFFKLVTGE